MTNSPIIEALSLDRLKNRNPTLCEHPLFELITDWYTTTEDHDVDLLDAMFQSFMAPSATSKDCSISRQHSLIVRSLFINLCAMVVPDLPQLLRPIHLFSFQPSILIDLEDSTAAKHISLQQSSQSTVKLRN